MLVSAVFGVTVSSSVWDNSGELVGLIVNI